jgi:hypothetical protein
MGTKKQAAAYCNGLPALSHLWNLACDLRSCRGLVEDASAYFTGCHIGRLKRLDHVPAGDPGIHGITARKHIDSGISVLGPGVDGQVTLRDHYHTTDTVGTELVKEVPYYLCSSLLGGSQHNLANHIAVIEHICPAAEQLRQDVAPESIALHHQQPPLGPIFAEA